MTDPELRDDVSRLRDKVTDLELSTTRKLGEIETKVSTAKHDISGIQQSFIAMNGRIDRFETQIKSDLKDSTEKLGAEVRAIGTQLAHDVKQLSGDITTVNTRGERKFSAYAGIGIGIGGTVSVIGGIFALAWKMIGGN